MYQLKDQQQSIIAVHTAAPHRWKQSSTRCCSGIRAVIFDVSGTVLDFGSRGPVVAFVELFARHGITVSENDARRPMGTHKKDHILALLAEPTVASRWQELHGALPDAHAVEQLYEEFRSLQIEVLKRHCDVIPGVPAVVQKLRARGIRIANTTGFDSNMMTGLIREAKAGGYESELWVTPDLVGQGRPAPWMAFFAARQLKVYPMSTFVKVGDTPADIAEAHAAGMWAVSVLECGNEVGLSQAELAGLTAEARRARVSAARARLATCGPHYLIGTTADLIPVIDEITARIARGERP
jgi:phosphonoacetaldehyde hydrolase